MSDFEQLEFTPFPEQGAYNKDLTAWRERWLPKYAAFLHLLESTVVHPQTHRRLSELLLKKLKLALRPSTEPPTDETLFIVTDGFHAYLRMSKAIQSLDAALGPLLRAATPRYCRLARFLDSLLSYEKEVARNVQSDSPSSEGSETSQEQDNALVKSLTANLAAPSHRLRLASLQILGVLDAAPDQQSALATMIQTEEIPLDPHNCRNISIYIRKLGQQYGSLADGSWLRQALPAFLFGILTVPLSPLWDDAVEALVRISETKAGEAVVSDLALEWLEVDPSSLQEQEKSATGTSPARAKDLACASLFELRDASRATGKSVESPSETLLQAFRDGQEVEPACYTNSRSRALKVLASLPGLAEKRSRRVVPHLLSWASDVRQATEDDAEDPEPSQPGVWPQADKKALLGVFSLFTNPKALYQSEKVYDALLGFMTNGDVEIQRLALKAILAWKQPGVKPYKDSLESLLDESKFKDALTALLQGENTVQPEHRQELIPVLLRLLYGRSISKKGASSARHSLHTTRLSVIRNLSVEDTINFLNIGLGRLHGIKVVDESGFRESIFSRDIIPTRNQAGLINMLDSIINELGTSVEPFTEVLANAILYCLVSACRKLQDSAESPDAVGEKNETSLRRAVRTTALKSLCTLFKNASGFDWDRYARVLVAEAVSPIIDRLPQETTEGVSWTLKLLSTWSLLPKQAAFLAIDERILRKVIDCLAVEKTKDEVKIFVLGIVRNLALLAQVEVSDIGATVKTQLLEPNMDQLLSGIDGVLRSRHELGHQLLAACIETVVELSSLVKNPFYIRSLVDISTVLLNQPSRKVNPKVKGSLLLVLEQFVLLDDLQDSSAASLDQAVYSTVAALFSFFKDRENRQSLSRVLVKLASKDPSITEVADLCAGLNSYVEDTIDQPNYDRRLLAFNAISRQRPIPFTSVQWMPLLHNLVFYIRQDEEFGILSTNSADGICRFIQDTEAGWDTPTEKPHTDLLAGIVVPALYSSIRDQSEAVRRDVLRTMGFLAEHLRSWPPVSDLVSLVSEDEESDRAFFFNILSPAVSRQLQALHLLENANEKSEFSPKNISKFFVPLLEHFVFGREQGVDDQRAECAGYQRYCHPSRIARVATVSGPAQALLVVY